MLYTADVFLSADILNVSELPEGQAVVESVMSYDWHIDTKYYTADVQLCTTNARTIGDENFADSVQAFVAYFDSQEVRLFLFLFAYFFACLFYLIFSLLGMGLSLVSVSPYVDVHHFVTLN